ncbi:MAG: 2-amino-4-hydroxy-6-hydroxymethyldihydropteridine diphosphokinase [Bacteroidota bacterium]
MNKTYLLLGSNVGNSKKQLADAIKLIRKNIGQVTRQSKLYVTAAWGNTNQPDFLNQVIVVETKFSSQQTINTILSIEKQMGRVRTVKNAPRIIDIDILFFNKDIVEEQNLVVPHPQIQNRRFVLIPLNELSPNFKHPVFQQSIHHLLKNCKDDLDVKKI